MNADVVESKFAIVHWSDGHIVCSLGFHVATLSCPLTYH